MALYIVFNQFSAMTVHVPFKENLKLKPLEIDDIMYIQADGHELAALRDRFAIKDRDGVILQFTIPLPDNIISRWFGDIAKTIIGNL